MFFIFLISLHVHIKRPYRFPLIIKIARAGSKSVARSVAIIIIFIINNGTF